MKNNSRSPFRTPTLRRQAQWAAVVVCALATLACSSETERDMTTTSKRPTTDDLAPSVVTAPEAAPPGGDAAELEAILRNIDGCVVLETPDRTEFTPVFPHGTHWNNETDALALPDGEEFRPGDSILVGGSEASGSGEVTGDAIPVCANDRFWQVSSVRTDE